MVENPTATYSAPVNATANRRRLQWSVLIFLTPTVIYPALGGIVEGRATTEKIATAWLMPLGLTWLLFLLLLLFLWNQRLVWATRLSFLTFLFFTLASNQLISSRLIASLENSVTPWRPDLDAPLDVVVVLGGGTKSSPAYGRVEGNDRLIYGAELYNSSQAKRLIATGESSVSHRPSPAAEAKSLWMRLGIPDSAIQTVGGANTYEEMVALKVTLDCDKPQRIGILTSAFHLPRAIRLARSAGLELVPLAADHRYDPHDKVRFRSLLPNEYAFIDSQLAIKEYIAMWFGR